MKQLAPKPQRSDYQTEDAFIEAAGKWAERSIKADMQLIDRFLPPAPQARAWKASDSTLQDYLQNNPLAMRLYKEMTK